MDDPAIALLYCGEALWSATLNGTPMGKCTYTWMTTLASGVTVIEITSSRADNDHERIGVLVRQGREWIAYAEDEGGYWEDFTVIRTFDGREIRWTNCHWVRIPVSREDHLAARRMPLAAQ